MLFDSHFNSGSNVKQISLFVIKYDMIWEIIY